MTKKTANEGAGEVNDVQEPPMEDRFPTEPSQSTLQQKVATPKGSHKTPSRSTVDVTFPDVMDLESCNPVLEPSRDQERQALTKAVAYHPENVAYHPKNVSGALPNVTCYIVIPPQCTFLLYYSMYDVCRRMQ